MKKKVVYIGRVGEQRLMAENLSRFLRLDDGMGLSKKLLRKLVVGDKTYFFKILGARRGPAVDGSPRIELVVDYGENHTAKYHFELRAELTADNAFTPRHARWAVEAQQEGVLPDVFEVDSWHLWQQERRGKKWGNQLRAWEGRR